jgi:PKD repeat protein
MRGMSGKKTRENGESAVSEVIGSILLISVVVIGVAIIGVALHSHSTPEKIPALSAVISEDTSQGIISLYHDGGDALSNQTVMITVDGVDKTAQFTNAGSPWQTWTVGEYLNYKYSGNAPGTVQIVYSTGSSAAILASADFSTGLPTASPTSTGTTTTATPTPTGTTTTATPTATPTPTPTPTPVAAPVANFTANPTTVTVGTAVQFTDTSTNTPTSWLWGFGDGSIGSTSENPQHTYSTTGTYTVTLTATNAAGSNSTTKSGYITATVPKKGIYVISAMYGDLTGNTGTIVNVTSEIQTLVNSGITIFSFNNSPTPGGIFSSNGTLVYTIADPDYGFLKSVTIAYSVNGVIQTPVTVTEGTVITL